MNTVNSKLGTLLSHSIKELSKVKDTDDVAKVLSKWSMELQSMEVHES